MRVLHFQVNNGFGGGVATYISALTRGQASHEMFVTLDNELSARMIARFDAAYGRATPVCFPEHYRVWQIPSAVRNLLRIVRMLRIDVIHAHTLRAGMLAALARVFSPVRLVYCGHGIRYTQKKGLLARAVFGAMERFVTRMADCTIAIRPSDLERYRKWLGPERLRLVRTRTDAPAIPMQVDAHPFRVGALGSLLPIKNPALFGRAAARMAAMACTAEMVWVGGGELLPPSQRDFPHVIFAGQVLHEEAMAWLLRFDVLVITSHIETFPMVALEAFSMGKAVISTAYPGYGDLFEDGRNALVIPPDDTEALVAAIVRLMRSDVLREELARNGRIDFERLYSPVSAMIEEVEGIYAGSAARR
ncbi:glycosyltransferase [Paludibacterium yongneupense]|uniref:glycosyltransferase n=1 Tax=Paludibacterium yongneupense TaxID=400061 RepID=UPI00040C5474|nr:glycosyltransferase [Paludibacterium yongneupense]